MTQATISTAADPATTFRQRPEPMSVRRTIIWEALEESRKLLLIKHLATLIRQARESPTIIKGDCDE